MFNLNNSVVRVVTRLNNAYTYDVEVTKVEGEAENFSYKLVGGFAAGLVQELSELVNFKIELVIDPPNLTYNFEEARNFSVDFYASSYSLRADRLKYVDPTFVTGSSKVEIFINHAWEGSTQDVVFAPFKPSVWVALAFMMCTLSAAFCVIARVTERMRLAHSFLHIVSIFITKDAGVLVKSTSSKLTQLTASFFAFLLMSAYSAKIVAIGTVKMYSIDSLAELAASVFDVSFDIGYGNGSVLQYYAEAFSSNPIMSKIVQKARSSKFKYDTFEKSMEEVQRRPFAYIIDEETGYSSAEKALGRIPCELGRISFAGVKYPWTMYVRKNSTFKPAINYGILKLTERGMINYLAKRWIPGRASSQGECAGGETSDFSRIPFTQLRTVFILLATGILAALLLLASEMWRYGKLRSRRIVRVGWK